MMPNVISHIIEQNETFPNNNKLPVLLYKHAVECDPKIIKECLLSNGWQEPWSGSIYPYHHYHSNTHEVLAIYSGCCSAQLGGDNGLIVNLEKGDVLLIPAGVAHKNISATEDFQCIGAYPYQIKYDMCYGEQNERPQTDKNIQETPLPKWDPIYGEEGPLFNYWKS